MAKFQIGDYVEYTNKTYPDGPVRGEIIGINSRYDPHYLIHDTSGRNHYISRWSNMLPGEPTHVFNKTFYAPDPYNNNLFRSNARCFRVSVGSRNIRSMEMRYDPKQMPDEEDDI
jgi:hypothetical protein